MTVKVIDAIVSLCPDALVVVRGNDVDQIEWVVKPHEIPSREEILAEIERLAPIALYKENRRVAYPSIGDQLDALYHAGVFPDEMAAEIQAVKDQYPKPA